MRPRKSQHGRGALTTTEAPGTEINGYVSKLTY